MIEMGSNVDQSWR